MPFRPASRRARAEHVEVEELDERPSRGGGDRFADSRFRGASRRPRTGARRTLLEVIRDIPHYLRLLGGLLTDRRVSTLDKVLVGAAIAYIVLPTDFIPDFIPFFGEVDDVFVLTTALQRLIANAGLPALLRHWPGDPAALRDLNLKRVVDAASFFLPIGMRRRLKKVLRR